MIDVPIAVRDALKDGGYKKNYRFVVGHTVTEDVYEDVTELELNTAYTLTLNGDYRIINDVHDNAFRYEVKRTSTWIGTTVDHPKEDPRGGYYYDELMNNMTIGMQVRITVADWTYKLQRKTGQTEEVFIADTEIDNNNLVKESVKIDERMCSDDTIKFGLCEGSQLEFQAFDIDNLTGKQIQAFVDVEYPVYSYDYDESTNKTTKSEIIEVCSIPMGWYDVQETSRQASTGIRKVSAYNKLKSDYLDTDVNALIVEEFGTTTVRVLDILQFLLRKFGIRTITADDILRNETAYFNEGNPKTFTPYKYTDSVNALSYAFTMLPWYSWSSYFPLSKNFYMEQDARVCYYSLTKVANGRPVQIKIDECLEQLDASIATYIQNQFALLAPHVNATAEQLFERLQKSTSNTNVQQPHGYFFFVEVHFKNSPTLRFGNNILGADGTFQQMSRRVFVGVTHVVIVTPLWIVYGYELSGGLIKRQVYHDTHSQYPQYEGITNTIKMFGEPTYDLRTPPRMPDGTAIPREMEKFFKVQVLTGGYSPAELLEIDVSKVSNITLRDIQTAVFESNCQFGRLDRTNNYFSGVEFNNGRLYPKGHESDPSVEALYPADDLYPMSQSDSGFKAMYSKLWADEGNVRSWRNLIITYKGWIEDEETHERSEAEKIYQVTINANGTDDYEVKDNWLFKNLTWADSDTEEWQEAAGLENIEDYADTMVAKMTGVSWFPFEMWCAGLPYIETGDEIEIHIKGITYISYVLRRTIKGIQNLQDEMINGTLDIF